MKIRQRNATVGRGLITGISKRFYSDVKPKQTKKNNRIQQNVEGKWGVWAVKGSLVREEALVRPLAARTVSS